MPVNKSPFVWGSWVPLMWVAIAFLLSSVPACNHPTDGPVPLSPRLESFVREPVVFCAHYEPVFSTPPWSSQEQEAARQYLCSHPDRTSYHLVLTLFSEWPKVYARIPDDTKAKILCDRLRQVRCADDWTVLGEFGPSDYVAAKSLLGLGPRVIPLLMPMLDDEAEIRWAGTRNMTTVDLPRRADLAYRYIMILRGQIPHYSVSVLQRDLWISQLKAELK